MERFCIITNRSKDETFTMTEWIMNYLLAQGKKVVITEHVEDNETILYTDVTKIPEDTECAIVLGGDGTLLKAAHDLRIRQIPILGINLGTLGFLAETEVHMIEHTFLELFHNRYKIEARMMLTLSVVKNEVDMDITPLRYVDSLNDIVITRNGFSRLIGVEIYVNDAFVNEFRGDGVIISTPTGSTGYNLSAGGPVVTPEAELMVITPICPHSLSARSIIVSANDTIMIKICQSKKTQEEEVIVTVDGSASARLQAQDYIIVKKAEHRTKLVRLPEINFFDILRTKLANVSTKSEWELK